MTTPDIRKQSGDHYPFGISQYVPKLTGVAQLGLSNDYMMDLGKPPAADTDGILDGEDVGTTYLPADATNPLLTNDNLDSAGVLVNHRYGANITAVASGAGTNNVTIVGYDYLGQKISKTKALNGATPISFGVAFKRIVSIAIASGGSITVDVGWGDALGLEYRTSKVNTEFVDGVPESSVGTLTAPVFTDPATSSTGDPRGLYDPNVTLDGAKHVYVKCELSEWLNSSNNGGLHGIAHYQG